MSAKPLTKIEQRDLHAIAKRINEREVEIQEAKAKAVSQINSTLAEAILQGQDLLKAKDMIPHGLFMDWLASNCPRVGQRECNRYMRLAANSTRVQFDTESDSIRAALLLCDEAEKEEKPSRQWVPYLEGLYRFGKALSFLKDEPVMAWPEEGRDKLKADLEPVAAVLWPEKWA